MKRVIQVAVDCALIFLCFWLAMALRLDGLFTEIGIGPWFTVAVIAPITVLTFAWLDLYRAIVRYMAEKAITVIVVGAALSSVAMLLVSQYFDLDVPRSVPGIYFSLLVLASGGTRLFMRTLYLNSRDKSRSPVVIYGAGEAGRFLMRSLQDSRNYRPAFFIDDDPRIQGSTIAGTPVVSFDQAKGQISRDSIKVALIAVDGGNPGDKRDASRRMAAIGLEVRSIPKVADLVAGRIKISTLQKVNIEELLGRDTVEQDTNLMELTIKNKSVLITGAGGSIGSELCRQIFQWKPSSIVLLETSEYALYTILEELRGLTSATQSETKLIPILGSVTERDVIERAITSNQIETIYHAAAYKHVPIVEENATEAVKNNALGTDIVAQLAGTLGVKHFTLISTDKAVRPTNVMGATKRLAELAMQAAARAHPNTKFCAVRFGNVLGSSGSVVPKFERQIETGGPITLTHPDITRYFMTVSEAAQLVIQASAMANNGEIYILDMGEPVKIFDLAKTMCALHGRKLHQGNDEDAPEGAIILKITGLRPGEKLYEELLITKMKASTVHPKIFSDDAPQVIAESISERILSLTQLNQFEQLAAALKGLHIGYTQIDEPLK